MRTFQFAALTLSKHVRSMQLQNFLNMRTFQFAALTLSKHVRIMQLAAF